MVNVYLPIEDRQVLALSIPFSDIERLSIRPVKWLRFVTFAVSGVRGHLSAMPNGLPVDYGSISLDHISEDYYYTPEGDYHFVDHSAMNDQITSSEQMPPSSRFRNDVMERDGPLCIFTGSDSSGCDAAHLIPIGNGDAYVEFVLHDRLHFRKRDALSKTLHAFFAKGRSAFLKTPNFALEPADIPRVEEGATPSSRISLHHLVPETGYDSKQRDARLAGTGVSPPSPVILDFTYGVAAYRRWGSGHDIREVMQQRFAESYKSIPITPHSSDGDPDDDDYIANEQRRRRNHSSNMSDGMLRAMDNVLALSMLLKGTTPELMAAERQKQEEAEELRAKEASRVKVQQWMQSS